MNRPLVIIGAGGHGREILDAVEALNAIRPTWRVTGFLADGETHPELAEARGIPILGGVDLLAQIDASYIIGIGSSSARARIDAQACDFRAEAVSLVHPSAILGSGVQLGAGCFVGAGAVLTTHIAVGRHTHIDVAASISHDCQIGQWCTIGPGARIAGWVTLRDGVEVGVGAVCRDRVEVGGGTFIGAGAVVVNDLPAGVTAVGAPARPLPR